MSEAQSRWNSERARITPAAHNLRTSVLAKTKPVRNPEETYAQFSRRLSIWCSLQMHTGNVLKRAGKHPRNMTK